MRAQTWFYTALTVILLVACDNNATDALKVKYGYTGGKIQSQCKVTEKSCTQAAAKDILTLPEYQKVVAIVGKKIADLHLFVLPEEDPKAASSSRMKDFFQDIAAMRSWHFITNLQQLPRDTTVLMRDSMAVQTATDIFIDSTQYGKLDETHRGQLLLRELVIELYINQYNPSAAALLEQMAKVDPAVRTEKSVARVNAEDQDEIINPVLPALSEWNMDDLNHVRTFTKALVGEGAQLTAEGLSKAATANFPRVTAVGLAGFARPYQAVQ